MSMTVLPGAPSCAPMAAGRPKPIVPRPPEVIICRGMAPAVELGGPHLVLADAGRDDRLALGLAVDLLDHVLRLGVLACRRST